MIKIYLDWNCMSNIEVRHPRLFELIKKCSDFVLFPYSIAHIRDVLAVGKNMSADNKRNQERDIAFLDIISSRLFLRYNPEKNRVEPLYFHPIEIIEKIGSDIQRISSLSLFSSNLYYPLKKGVQDKIPLSSFKEIQGASYNDVFEKLSSCIQSLSKSLSIGERFAIHQLDDSYKDNLEEKIKKLSSKLDVFGFRPEKKYKSFSNIDVDSSHMLYAAFCNYLVTEDGKMAEKAKAIYSKLSIPTKVINSKELEAKLEEFLVYNKQSPILTIEAFFNMFDTIEKADTSLMGVKWTDVFVLKCNLNRYIFDKIMFFLSFVKSTLSINERQYFEVSFERKILSTDSNEVADASYQWTEKILLCSDPLSPVPLPCMIVMLDRVY